MDTPVSDSQWASIFNDWVADDTTAAHGGETDLENPTAKSYEQSDKDKENHEQADEVDEPESEDTEGELGDHVLLEEALDDEENRKKDQEGTKREGKKRDREKEEEQGPGDMAGIDEYNEDVDTVAEADGNDGYFESHEQADDEIMQEDKTISEEYLDENYPNEEESDDCKKRPFDCASTEKGA